MIFYLPLSIIILSLLPTGIITGLIFIKNKNNEINKFLYLKMLIFGALSVIPAIFIVSLTTTLLSDSIINKYLIKPFLSIALIEESVKLLVIKILLFRNKKFKTLKDGIIYSIAISIGFAFFENILYLTGDPDQIMTFISRTVTTFPLHAVCGAFMGFYIGLSKESEINYWGKALISTTLLHGLYNCVVILQTPFNFLSLILIIIAIFVLKRMYNKKITKQSI